jgi:dynein heavy chain
VPLDRWKKEAFYFNKLMKLEFFSKYRLFKNFAKWKKHIRKTAMKSTTDKLRNELMIGDRFLRRSLLGIKDSCFVM